MEILGILSRINRAKEEVYIRDPLPVVPGRGVCKRHQWDEEFRNYDTDDDVFNEIRMEQQLIKRSFIDQVLLLPYSTASTRSTQSEMKRKTRSMPWAVTMKRWVFT